MLQSKLAWRNARRSIKDYMIYMITMTVIAALMMAFNSMMFSKDIISLCKIAGVMGAMIGLASFFILIIVSWLIHYMVRFMMEKRSREFGTYLILGMNKKEITRLFLKENRLMGNGAFLAGIIPGMFLQQILTSVIYSVFEKNYKISLDFSLLSLVTSYAIYLIMFSVALRKMKRSLKKLSIREFMDMSKINEEVHQNGTVLKKLLFLASVAYLIFFVSMLYRLKINIKNFFILLAFLVASLYLIYCGLSAWITDQIVKKKPRIYKRDSLFLQRQFACKMKSMQFTMGTITVLFVFALLGCTFAMMFNDYQSKQLKYDLPFDIILFSDDNADTFEKQKDAIHKEVNISDELIYRIYENETTTVNNIMYSDLPYFTEGIMSRKKNTDTTNEYFDYDTYMKLSDYNKLRRILGYEEVSLGDSEYLIHMQRRVSVYLQDSFQNVTLNMEQGKKLNYAGIHTEPFAQNGMNGADYVIVVPDQVIETMKPYYSLYAAKLDGTVSDGLYDTLKKIRDYTDEEGETNTRFTWGYGTNEIISCSDFVLIHSTMTDEMKYVLTAVAFPCVYIALVFVCVALTVMSVQQVSDSAKYQFRYSVLSKLGLKERELDHLIFKQLAFYYFCPYIITVIVSGSIAMFLGKQFVFYTGLNTASYWYYTIALLTFSIVYAMYFAFTYVEFRRNVYARL